MRRRRRRPAVARTARRPGRAPPAALPRRPRLRRRLCRPRAPPLLPKTSGLRRRRFSPLQPVTPPSAPVTAPAIRHRMPLLQAPLVGPNRLKNKNEKLKVGIVYLCSNRVGTAKDQLSSKYGSHKTIDLEVNFLDNLNESWYDVVILSTVFYHKAQLPDKISTALTRARLCLWIIGEGNDLCAAGDIWEKLVNNAVERRLFATLTSSVLSSVMKNLELNFQDKPTVVDSSLPENIMQKPGQEFTWKGRPHNRKDILAQVRDQKDARDACTFQASLGAIESLNKFQCSCFNPPQAFTFDLCFDDLKTKYEQIIKGELTSEERKKRGKRRLETSLDIAKDEGIVGSDSADQSEGGPHKV
ncbi:hypothetical protein ACP70R_008758 [Stipagrostis hirtigluma subsp. patula]